MSLRFGAFIQSMLPPNGRDEIHTGGEFSIIGKEGKQRFKDMSQGS